MTTLLRRSSKFPRLVRGLASAVLPQTQTTTLKNGFTIATEYSPYAQTATVGVWIDCGSRNETLQNNGTAHFLEHLSFKGTKNRSQQQLEMQIENMGAHLNAYTSRNAQTVYYSKSFKDDVPANVEILSDILQNSLLENGAIERERDVILREQEEVEKQTEELVFDHLHATAFQDHSLGRTILGPEENIKNIKQNDLLAYIDENYRSDRMILVGAGGVPHQTLVELADKYFSKLVPSEVPTTLGIARDSPPQFVGSEVRIRDDTMNTSHITLAVNGVSWKSPDYFTMLIMQAIIGNWDRALGAANHMSSRLSGIVSQNHLANSFMSFSTAYSDAGLWGIYLVSESKDCLDDLVHFTLKEWSRLSISVTEAELERAKTQLKASLLLTLDGTTAVAEDIGRQIITTGRRMTPGEVDFEISKVTVADVQRVAQEKLWDQDLAIAAVGSIEGLLDYNRIRADMSLNRW
ncbi:putative mitochondrial-processing peptidase subunit beta [Neolecta irregularis DAH-3]|uniref:mitochondrial processing peptidase n=1 Tax=Neolecta irregularis (strain DAH-3) TaxID=1198029 RepID=A0A1U7LKD4_NEOID|nr:putative mitochondrial-processing peptidase subunit beta [Neolecta irregularis DAH-3]|eukprot:OLL23114.1 putative mitochondrial-processing peptidase subunit beta [Neolecta irregularis DAH-3]